MDYPLENLGPERFQQLCQALLAREYPRVQCFPVAQPDGGRDAVSYFPEGGGDSPIHTRHLVIDDGNGVWVPFQARGLKRAERFFSRSAASVAHAPAHHLLLQEPAIHFVIVYDEHAHAPRFVHRDASRDRLGVELQGQHEPERGTFSGPAGDSNGSSHQVDQPFGNRQGPTRYRRSSGLSIHPTG